MRFGGFKVEGLGFTVLTGFGGWVLSGLKGS